MDAETKALAQDLGYEIVCDFAFLPCSRHNGTPLVEAVAACTGKLKRARNAKLIQKTLTRVPPDKVDRSALKKLAADWIRANVREVQKPHLILAPVRIETHDESTGFQSLAYSSVHVQELILLEL